VIDPGEQLVSAKTGSSSTSPCASDHHRCQVWRVDPGDPGDTPVITGGGLE